MIMFPKKKVYDVVSRVLSENVIPCGKRAKDVTKKSVKNAVSKTKQYVVEEAVKACDFLAECEVPELYSNKFKNSCCNQNLTCMDYCTPTEESEPVEGVFRKLKHLCDSFVEDSYFTLRRVSKNKRVSKKSIRFLSDKEFLEALNIALDVKNSRFIKKSSKIREIPCEFTYTVFCKKDLEWIKFFAAKYPERNTASDILEFLIENEEYELCYKIVQHSDIKDLSQLGAYKKFVNKLYYGKGRHKKIRDKKRGYDIDECDYAGWKILYYLYCNNDSWKKIIQWTSQPICNRHKVPRDFAKTYENEMGCLK